jgi:hypothetical protein
MGVRNRETKRERKMENVKIIFTRENSVTLSAGCVTEIGENTIRRENLLEERKRAWRGRRLHVWELEKVKILIF